MDSLHSEISCLGGDKDAIRGVASIPWVSETKGGVAPIGWVSPATILIDQALNDYEVVWLLLGTHMRCIQQPLPNFLHAQAPNQ